MEQSTTPITQRAIDRQQRRRRIAMSAAEADEFLSCARTARVASAQDGKPHVSPLWFVWHAGSIWLYSLTDSRRFRGLSSEPAVAVVIDDGDEYDELRGVEILGNAEFVGEVPRVGDLVIAELDRVEKSYAEKYHGREGLNHDGRHAWLKVTPEKIVSWDFRKIPGAQ